MIALRDGSRLWTGQISREGSQLAVQLLDGVTLIASADSFYRAISALQMFGHDIAYLSDLPSAGYKNVPFLSTAWDYGVDRNLLGGWLRAGGRFYPKGLAMHSTSRLAFALDRPFRRLVADIPVDDAAEGRGSVVFRLFVERPSGQPGATSWQVAFESPIGAGRRRSPANFQ